MGIFFKGKKQKREKELVQAFIKEEVKLAELEDSDEDEYYDPDDDYYDPEVEFEENDTLEGDYSNNELSDEVENDDDTDLYNDEEQAEEDIQESTEDESISENELADTTLAADDTSEIITTSESEFKEEEFDSEALMESILDEYFGIKEDQSNTDSAEKTDEPKSDNETAVNTEASENTSEEILENISESEIIDESSEVIESEVSKEDFMDKIIEQNVMTVVEPNSNEVALSKSTGKLEKMLDKHGEDYTKELSKAFESLIEKDPSAAATIFMAATVATLQTFDGDTDKMAEELDIDDRDISMAEYEFHARYKKQ